MPLGKAKSFICLMPYFFYKYSYLLSWWSLWANLSPNARIARRTRITFLSIISGSSRFPFYSLWSLLPRISRKAWCPWIAFRALGSIWSSCTRRTLKP